MELRHAAGELEYFRALTSRMPRFGLRILHNHVKHFVIWDDG